MTIRRQYQLPNCALVLDGLNIDPTPDNEAVMSLLVNAECRISGLERSLNGGDRFFSALVHAVSQYSQEILSGFAHPQVNEGDPLLVHINPGDGPYHHLVVQPEIADLGESGDGRAIDIKLSAVQLFDLTEAVDQFLSDSQTLPDLEAPLSPLPRRFVRPEAPLSDRALPALLGVGSVAIAALAFSLLPVPEQRDPALDTRAREEQTQVADGDSDSPNDTPPTGDISDETSSADDNAAEDDSRIAVADNTGNDETSDLQDSENLDSEDSDSENSDSESLDEAELGDPEETPDDSSALFEQPSEILQDINAVERLNQSLKRAIVENREQPRVGDEAIAYRVRMNADGVITGYEPIDAEDIDAVDETPLPELVESAPEDTPVADYRVVFTERGVVEVSPWLGWSYYE
ncbi:MAG: DUF4335 domain-containing protein [Phormidesmis sp.]